MADEQNDVTAQVLTPQTSANAGDAGAVNDPATPKVTGTTGDMPNAGTDAPKDVPIVEQLSIDEAREKSLEDRVSAAEGKLNELTDALNIVAGKINAAPASAPASGGDTAVVGRLMRKVFGEVYPPVSE